MRTSAGGRLRWSICAMLFYATTVNYMDRQVLGILQYESDEGCDSD